MGTTTSGSELPPNAFDLRHHSDSGALVEALTRWCANELGPGADPRLSIGTDDIANGMSSSTLLFDLDWTADGDPRHAELVARIAPETSDVTVFPAYDLGMQFRTMRAVAEAGTVEIPVVHWLEETGAVLGRPFFVMDRVAGKIPPDMLPYTFGDNWLHDASSAERSRLQDAMIDVLVGLHAIDDVEARFTDLVGPGAPEVFLHRHLSRTRAWYDWSVAQNGCRSSLVEAGLGRLETEFPADPGPTVLSWGDARIGNVIFDDFAPVAILDWEMADLGPRELDLVWLTYSHRVFQDLAEGFELDGLPDFLTISEVADTYKERSGHTVQHLDWHLLYAAVRWACAFLRTGAREAHMNGTPLLGDGDTLLHNRSSLAALVEGSFPLERT